MAGEAYQCCRPASATVVRPHLPAPNAHTIASEPRVHRRRRPVALSSIEASWLEPRSEHGLAVHGRALSRSAQRDAVPAATQQNQAVGERALPPNPRPADRSLGWAVPPEFLLLYPTDQHQPGHCGYLRFELNRANTTSRRVGGGRGPPEGETVCVTNPSESER